MPRVYEVTIKHTLYVLAESESAAQMTAIDHVRDEAPEVVRALVVDAGRALPDSTLRSLPWLAYDVAGAVEAERTVGEWLAGSET